MSGLWRPRDNRGFNLIYYCLGCGCGITLCVCDLFFSRVLLTLLELTSAGIWDSMDYHIICVSVCVSLCV